MLRVSRFISMALVALLTVPAVLHAQEARGTISGTVKDASGAVTPGATVTITNVAMQTTVTVVTNEAGFFQVPFLIPGME